VTRCRKALLGLALAATLALSGCSGDDRPKDVVLVTHDSFAVSADVKRAFERESGLKLHILKAGDAGEVVTRALLTAGNPEGDVLFGVDNNLLERALAGDVFEPYTPPALGAVGRDLGLAQRRGLQHAQQWAQRTAHAGRLLVLVTRAMVPPVETHR